MSKTTKQGNRERKAPGAIDLDHTGAHRRMSEIECWIASLIRYDKLAKHERNADGSPTREPLRRGRRMLHAVMHDPEISRAINGAIRKYPSVHDDADAAFDVRNDVKRELIRRHAEQSCDNFATTAWWYANKRALTAHNQLKVRHAALDGNDAVTYAAAGREGAGVADQVMTRLEVALFDRLAEGLTGRAAQVYDVIRQDAAIPNEELALILSEQAGKPVKVGAAKQARSQAIAELRAMLLVYRDEQPDPTDRPLVSALTDGIRRYLDGDVALDGLTDNERGAAVRLAKHLQTLAG
ncbi:MAG: hypothetical protein QM679_03460 [Patulibacter sp.]